MRFFRRTLHVRLRGSAYPISVEHQIERQGEAGKHVIGQATLATYHSGRRIGVMYVDGALIGIHAPDTAAAAGEIILHLLRHQARPVGLADNLDHQGGNGREIPLLIPGNPRQLVWWDIHHIGSANRHRVIRNGEA
jgi:hypothetical protein